MTDTTHSDADLSNPTSGGERTAIEVVRSEEQLHVGSSVRVSGRAVLRRYVITETVTETFEVRREEVRLDYEPVNSLDAPAATGPAFDSRVVEMVLHREVPVTRMEVVAVERVRLHVDTITEDVQVSADLGKERLDVDLAEA